MDTSVYRAVADPHRRHLLDLLRDRGEQNLNDLCRSLPITRQAVAKHLTLLEDAELVRSRRLGRERIHSLNPAPLRDLMDWAGTYTTFWNERLDALESRLEQPD